MTLNLLIYIARYETKGDGIVSTESLERLLNDLDFYIPAPSGSEAAEALRSAYIAKLDFFEEALPGVNISALQVAKVLVR